MQALSRLKRSLLSLMLGLVAASSASAMEFAVRRNDDGLRMVVARGPIVAGDTERLRRALEEADRDRQGAKLVALNSPGGQIGEAVSMAGLIAQEKVSTVVWPSTTCASACAQIVFLAGEYHYVMDRGRLGLHICAIRKSPELSSECNELIARLAALHGVSLPTLLAYLEPKDPAKPKWLNAEQADCWGLTRWPPGVNRGVGPDEVPPCLVKAAQAAVNRPTGNPPPR